MQPIGSPRAMSALYDGFDGMLAGFWSNDPDQTYGYDFGSSTNGETLLIGAPDGSTSGKIRTADVYDFDSVFIELDSITPGGVLTLLVQTSTPTDEYGATSFSIDFEYPAGSPYIWVYPQVQDGANVHRNGWGIPHDQLRYIKVEQFLDAGQYKFRLFMGPSTNWSGFSETPVGLPQRLVGKLSLNGWSVAIQRVGEVWVDQHPDDSYPYPDDFDPGATLPGAGPECATLLDLIRTFSGAVKRSVRLTGPTSIEMVDPNAPLPAGWHSTDAPTLYSSTSRKLTAGADVLSLLAGDLVMEASATLISDDVRLVTSDWQIPGRLPMYGSHPAPVKRVSYEFTPTSFRASVEFHVPAVPLELRRT